ncbi:MAG: SDR family NAD(P)-dependent oxidoreductase [Lewinellaceae bacterium]|nr:SDR family NAD(P)-dependent oxidoreductase [Lewinellaceae bacterium]
MKLNNRTINRLKNTYGNWVVITGATSGMGKEMALRFGEAGFNLVITGRREHLLNELSTLLFDKYKVEVVPIPGDLSMRGEVHKLIQEIAHLNIGVAVLNAGFGTSGKFINADLNKELNMLDLNCKALMMLTHHFANKIKAQPQRGAIVLLSSMVAFQGVPNAAHYAATKAYVQSLGEALAVELKEEGVDILCAAPGPVESGFSERANMKMNLSLKPEDVGVPMIRAIGKQTTLLPGLLTKFLVYNLRMVPRWAKVRIMGNVMKGFTKHQLQ